MSGWGGVSASAVRPSGPPHALRQPLERFLFDGVGWSRPRALARLANAHEATMVPGFGSDAAALGRTLARLLPPRRLDIELLSRELRGRLALLPRGDWLRLGLCVAVLPFCGQILRSMDGHFRRVVQQALDESALSGLEGQAAVPERPVFLGGPGAWRSADRLAAGGVRAALEQVCMWPDPIRQRFDLQFEPEELDVPASVGGLNMTWLEIACKASWPDHPWLWC
jgi:hypothetical protein